jgi:hypothetical protein
VDGGHRAGRVEGAARQGGYEGYNRNKRDQTAASKQPPIHFAPTPHSLHSAALHLDSQQLLLLYAVDDP